MICEYGCGQEANYQLKNGKWCCSITQNQCEEIRKKVSRGNKGQKRKKYCKRKSVKVIITDLLCDYGCGQIARYEFPSGKICCSKHHHKCSTRRKIISIATKESIKREDPELKKLRIKKIKNWHNNLNFKEEFKSKVREKVNRPESKQKLKDAAKLRTQTSEWKDFISKLMKKLWNDKNSTFNSIEYRTQLSTSISISHNQESFRIERSKIMKELWKNEEYRKNQVDKRVSLWKDKAFCLKMEKAFSKKPNKLEMFFQSFLDNFYPGIFEYVGNFSFWINGRNPDFIDKKGKRIIEIFGSYWHKKEDEIYRSEHFEREDYKVLVLWDFELLNQEEVHRKLNNFIGV